MSFSMSNSVFFCLVDLGYIWVNFRNKVFPPFNTQKEPPGTAMSAAEHLHFGPDVRLNVPKLITTVPSAKMAAKTNPERH